MFEFLKKYYRYLFKNPPKYKLTFKTKTERHGNLYGGWNIIPNSLNPTSIIYSFGIGEDISFDLSIINKYNCFVQAFDPTPRVSKWLETQEIPDKFKSYPIGLSNINGKLTFYEPIDKNHISHTAVSDGTTKAISVNCNKLITIMNSLGNDKLDLLKMDIEGFEYDVMSDIIDSGIKPIQILVEFHHFLPGICNIKTEQAINQLENYGYRLFYVSDSFCEYSFINEENIYLI